MKGPPDDARERLAFRVRHLEAALAQTALWLESDEPIDDATLAGAAARLDRVRLAWDGMDGGRGGEQRAWVLDQLFAIGLLALAPDVDPLHAWLELRAFGGDDGPFTDLTEALVDEQHEQLVLAAARALAAHVEAEVRPGRHSSASAVYASLRALLVALPAPGDLTDEALRQTVRRWRKRNVTASVQERAR